MKARLYQRSDLEDVIDLFYDCVHSVNAPDYTSEQLDAMAPEVVDHYRWESSLEKNHTLVVEDDEGKIIGFGNVGMTGYLDRLFVDKDHLREGIASMLVERLEEYARAKGNEIIDTTSSITSRPFFEAKGFRVVEEQINERHGVRILRYLMEKRL